MTKQVGITETSFRDGNQSLLATRLRTEDMLTVAQILDKVGFYSIEVWGGATFDSCIRYLNEDPWERLRTLRKYLPNARLQMLLRGQNLVGYRQYPDDVVDEFVNQSIDNGIDIIRVFDALNDLRNLERVIKATRKAGGHAQAAIVYTISPVHVIDTYIEIAKDLCEIGASSICIKDMAGLLTPKVAAQLIARLKREIPLPIHLHCHSTAGLATVTYWAAIQAGVDVVDTALSALALGTSQPPTESLVAALAGTKYDAGINLAPLFEANTQLKEVLLRYQLLRSEVDTRVLVNQIPGGMLSNLKLQLRQQKMEHRYDEVLAEVPRVRKEMGYPPLVTPISQIIGVQALLNVVTGKRYGFTTKEIKDYVGGWYGRPPSEIDEEIRNQIVEGEPISARPADFLEPAMATARDYIVDHVEQDEDILTYALFPEAAKEFFRKREKKEVS